MRIGATRQVHRGIKSEDWQRKNYFDLWMPLLSPSAKLLEQHLHQGLPFNVFARRYRMEMKRRESWQVIELLATVSLFQSIGLGCFCEDEARCHRSVLLALVRDEAEKRAVSFSKLHQGKQEGERLRFASPVCFANEDK